jgi:hypothetical protein
MLLQPNSAYLSICYGVTCQSRNRDNHSLAFDDLPSFENRNPMLIPGRSGTIAPFWPDSSEDPPFFAPLPTWPEIVWRQ